MAFLSKLIRRPRIGVGNADDGGADAPPPGIGIGTTDDGDTPPPTPPQTPAK
jgi:hypothetical protein